MARVKNEHGLTHQQELFCQYVVDAYGDNPKGILVAAYRKAYNCKSDSKIETHYSAASRLMNDCKITTRIEQLREEQSRLVTINREKIVSMDADILELDPLSLWIEDEESHHWRLRYIHEIPRRVRKLLSFKMVGRRLVPDIDKDAAKKRLIDLLGGTHNINVTGNILGGELRVGFDDDEE